MDNAVVISRRDEAAFLKVLFGATQDPSSAAPCNSSK
jgi:hypothetical protein